ncbi:hypothetical protein JTB14_037244 [Gonioctena quinquepunctata]|nr:hypothetical protein JTB14_037244 [Gonioctena quinquepunctata]
MVTYILKLRDAGFSPDRRAMYVKPTICQKLELKHTFDHKSQMAESAWFKKLYWPKLPKQRLYERSPRYAIPTTPSTTHNALLYQRTLVTPMGERLHQLAQILQPNGKPTDFQKICH